MVCLPTTGDKFDLAIPVVNIHPEFSGNCSAKGIWITHEHETLPFFVEASLCGSGL